MLENEDYYFLNKIGDSEGCCLLCEKAEEGCLCFECKCRRCYWYVAPEDWDPEDWDFEKGKCGIAYKQKQSQKKFKGLGKFMDYNNLKFKDNTQTQLFKNKVSDEK